MQYTKKSDKSAFGLIELSIVLVVLAVIVAATLPSKTIKVSNRNIVNVNANLRVINEAIARYVSINKRFPCPASINEDSNSANFGKSVGAYGNCSGAGIYFGGTNNSLAFGFVPVNDLNIALDNAKDSYNSKILYVVDKSTTSETGFKSGLPKPNSLIKIFNNKNGKIEMADYLVISYGKNTASAFSFNSTEQNPSSKLIDEQDNSIIVGTSPAFDNIFISASKQKGFDDKLISGNREDLVKRYNIEYISKCTEDVSEVLYGKTMNWTTDANPGQEVPSDTPCPEGYKTGPKYPLKKCTKDGEWGVITSHCQAPLQCEILKVGIIPKIVLEGSGTIACDKPGYTGNVNYNCNASSSNSKNGNLVLTGSCTLKTQGCYVKNVIGIDNTTVDYGSGSIQCRSGFTGSVNYNCSCDLGVNFYDDCSYKGIKYGKYNVGNYNSAPSNGISSFELDSGVVLYTYTGSNFSGNLSKQTSSSSCLDLDWDNSIRSYKVEIEGVCPDKNTALTTEINCLLANLPDFSETIDKKVGFNSYLNNIESNVKLWLDASNIDGANNNYISSGLPISRWYDLSGNNRNVTQSLSASQPIYDGSAVYFDGANDYIWSESSENLSNATIFAVIDVGNIDFTGANAGGAAVSIQQRGVDNFDAIVYHERSDAYRKFMNGSSGFSRTYVSSVTETDTKPLIIQNQIKSGDFKIYRNGVIAGSAGFNATTKSNTRFILGSRHFISSTTNPVTNGYWHGKIYEVIILDKEVSEEERFKITYYLSKKWGLEDRVDSDGDGTVDSQDADPAGIFSIPDFKNKVDDIVGFNSGLNVQNDLQLWLDASNIDGRRNATLNPNSLISMWQDLSGKNRNATQTNATIAPTYDGTYIDFSQNDVLFANNQVPIGNNWEFYVIYDFSSHNQHGGWNTLFRGSGEDHHLIIHYTNHQIGLYDNYGYDFLSSGLSANSYSGMSLIRMTSADLASIITVNGNNSGVINKLINAPLYAIGNYQGLYQGFGKIAEIIVFNRNLSGKERSIVSHYLAKKWNITTKVDSDEDGIVDASDSDPAGLSKYPDFSNTVQSVIGEPTTLNEVEPAITLWVDGSNIDFSNNSSLSNGSIVHQWKDLSGNNTHLFKLGVPTYAANALNSKGVVNFSTAGMESVKRINMKNIFIVHKTPGVGGNYFFDFRNGNGSYMWQPGSGSNWLLRKNGVNTGGAYYQNNIFDNQWQVNYFQADSNSNAELYLHSRYTNNEQGHGQVAEIIVIDKFLTQDQINHVERYLAKKWGLGDKVDGGWSNWTSSQSCNWIDATQYSIEHQAARSIDVGSNYIIKQIVFASYGTPANYYQTSWCHSWSSYNVVYNWCMNRSYCTLYASNGYFGDPCVGTVKRLYVSYRYGLRQITQVRYCNNPAPAYGGSDCVGESTRLYNCP